MYYSNPEQMASTFRDLVYKPPNYGVNAVIVEFEISDFLLKKIPY